MKKKKIYISIIIEEFQDEHVNLRQMTFLYSLKGLKM